MEDQLPDVLHSAGITPHEVGWLQLHAEPAVRAADGRGVAELWLQAAVDPPGSGRLQVLDAATGAALGEAPLPPVNRGAAIRWRIPLQLPEATTALRFQIEAPIPEGAERIRSPWKLLDTIELVMPDDEEPGVGLGLAAPLAASPHRAARRPSGMKVHPARARPRELVADVVAASPEETFSAAIETLWVPGEPLQGESLRQRLRGRRASGPTCPSCGAALLPGAEFCPSCLGPVSAAAAASAALPPLAAFASAPAPGSPAAPPSATPEAAPSAAPAAISSAAPEAVRCGLHPERASTGTCSRCGAFFCEECESKETPGLCAACEAKRSSPAVIGPQIYRDAALIHGVLAAALVLRPFLSPMLDFSERWTVLGAIPFAALAGLVRNVRRPGVLLVAMAADVLALLEAFLSEDWSLLLLGGLALALTAMLWQRLSSFDSADSPPPPAAGSTQP